MKTLKQFLSLTLALLILSLPFSAFAANELPKESPNNTPLPEIWRFVAVDSDQGIEMVNSDGSISDHVTAFGLNQNALVDGDFCYFVDQGHNYGGLSVKLNWVQGAKVTFTFTGTAVAVLSQFHDTEAGCSDIEFVLDGESVGTLAATDYCAPAIDGSHILQKIYFQKTDLELGEHTLEVINAGEKAVCLDGFAYIGDPNAPIETDPPMTFAPVYTLPEETEEPETNAPATNNDATGSAAQTEKPTEKGGCGSSITVAPILLTAILGTAVMASKKRS